LPVPLQAGRTVGLGRRWGETFKEGWRGGGRWGPVEELDGTGMRREGGMLNPFVRNRSHGRKDGKKGR